MKYQFCYVPGRSLELSASWLFSYKWTWRFMPAWVGERFPPRKDYRSPSSMLFYFSLIWDSYCLGWEKCSSERLSNLTQWRAGIWTSSDAKPTFLPLGTLSPMAIHPQRACFWKRLGPWLTQSTDKNGKCANTYWAAALCKPCQALQAQRWLSKFYELFKWLPYSS